MEKFCPLMILAAVFCASCAPKPESPAYALGYADGCSAAYSLAGKPDARYIRNETLFNDSTDYRTGWTSGERACFPAAGRSVGVGVGVGGGTRGVGGGVGVHF